MTDSDRHGVRHKMLEKANNDVRFSGEQPVLCRIDGRNFHAYCQHLERPFSPILIDVMNAVTRELVSHTQATWGYTQSDEISLCWMKDPFFAGKQHKMTSVIASLTTAFFNRLMQHKGIERIATFDNRVWECTSPDDPIDYLIWRWKDCVKNSVSITASCYFSHQELYEKHTHERIEMLKEKDIDWHVMNPFFRFGQLIVRHTEQKMLTQDERNALPDKHHLKYCDESFERKVIKTLYFDRPDTEYIQKLISDERM